MLLEQVFCNEKVFLQSSFSTEGENPVDLPAYTGKLYVSDSWHFDSNVCHKFLLGTEESH